MVTTMLNGKLKFKLSPILIGVVTALSLTQPVKANDLSVTADVASSLIYQDTFDSERQSNSSASLSIVPRFNALYESRTLQGTWSGRYTYLERDFNDASRSDNYGDYSYNVGWAPLDDILLFQASGAMAYRNVNVNGTLINDFLLNDDELSKTRTNRYLAGLNLQNNDYFDANGQIFYSDTNSEQSAEDSGRLDNDSYGASGIITNDDDARLFFWSIGGQFNSTERSDGRDDFVTRQAEATGSLMIVPRWGITASARHEGNQTTNAIGAFAVAREYNSYGVGLTYRQSPFRFITISANRSDSEVESNDGESFVGVDLQWAFSTRTNLSARYGRRFYGDSGEMDFTYATKHIRMNFNYSEEVTSFSRLISDPENLGIFVCTTGSINISDCFQPSSLNYDLQVGEEFREFTTLNLEIDDEIILRKSAQSSIGFRQSRLSAIFSYRYSDDEYIETNRLRRGHNFDLSASIELGRYTAISSSIRYATFEEQAENFIQSETESWNTSFGISRQFGRSLTADLRFIYIDRNNKLETSFGGSDLTDRRVAFSVNYQIK